MRVPGACIASVTDESDRRALLDLHTYRDAVGSSLEMRVIQYEFFIRRHLIDRDTPAFAVEELDDLTVRRRDDGCPGWRHNVDRIVDSAFGSR